MNSNPDIIIFSVLFSLSLIAQFLVLVLLDIKLSPASADVDGEIWIRFPWRQVEPPAQSSPNSPALISWVIRPPIRTLLFSLLFIWEVGLHGFHDRSMTLGFSWEKGNNLSLLMVCFLYRSSYLLLTCSSAYEEVVSEITPIKPTLFLDRTRYVGHNSFSSFWSGGIIFGCALAVFWPTKKLSVDVSVILTHNAIGKGVRSEHSPFFPVRRHCPLQQSLEIWNNWTPKSDTHMMRWELQGSFLKQFSLSHHTRNKRANIHSNTFLRLRKNKD